MAKRHVYILEQRVTKDTKEPIYTLELGGAVVQYYGGELKKSEAVEWAAIHLKNLFTRFGQLSELKVRVKGGEFSKPRTYGKDPRRTKG